MSQQCRVRFRGRRDVVNPTWHSKTLGASPKKRQHVDCECRRGARHKKDKQKKTPSIFRPGRLHNIPSVRNAHGRVSDLLFRSLKRLKLSILPLVAVPCSPGRGRRSPAKVRCRAARRSPKISSSLKEPHTLCGVNCPNSWSTSKGPYVTSAKSYALIQTKWTNWSWLHFSRTQGHCF